METKRGKVIILSAPSGAGKSTIIRALMQQFPELNLHFSISATSRPPRGAERDGVEYYFLSPEEFKSRIARGDFLEYMEVYEGRFYGTLKAEVDRRLAAGDNIVCDIDVVGAANIKRIYGDEALSVFIQPPGLEELRRRLTSRGTETPEAVESRMARAEYELSCAPSFDEVVVNDDLSEAVQRMRTIIGAYVGLDGIA